MEALDSSNHCEAATIIGSQSTRMEIIGPLHEDTIVGMEEPSLPLDNVHDEYRAEDDVRLYRAALKGDWKEAYTSIRKRKNIVREQITSKSETALHIAVAAKHKEFVKNLLGEMNPSDLALRNDDNNTALYFSAASGVVEIAEMLITKNSYLPNIPGGGGMTPIHMAALFGHAEMVRYLYRKTNFGELSDIFLLHLFLAIISADIYDVALWMLNEDEKNRKVLKLSGIGNGEMALHIMARKSSKISHKRQLNLFKNLANSTYKGFYPEAKMRTLAHQLVEELWKPVAQLPAKEVSKLLRSPSRLLNVAAEAGNIEFLVILIRSCPDLIWKADDKNQTLFHVAALYRHVNIFNIIYEFGGIKDFITSYKDVKSKNNLLHLVARLPPPSRLHVVSGAALQMQRELLWFKAVEKIVPRSYIEAKNSDGDVPHVLFTKKHDNLRKEGEKWMKETATACMVVATLIATMVFAAAFTIPGGNDDKSPGFPRFRKKFLFDMFILSDSCALLSSVTSIVIFLSILTSRYAEDDFQTALPTKLMLGLLALFVSIISMILAFAAAMTLIRDKDSAWTLILIIFLASLTAISFVLLHFRLWYDTLRSAYFSKFLFHRRKSGILL